MTVIQRFGGGVNLHVHFHTLVLEGVFTEGAAGELRFMPVPAPTDAQVARLLAMIRSRACRVLRRRGFDPEDASEPPIDPLADESPVLAGLAGAAVMTTLALDGRGGDASPPRREGTSGEAY